MQRTDPGGRGCIVALFLPLVLAAAAAGADAAAATRASSVALPVVPVRCEMVGGYGRLSFLWPETVAYEMTREGPDIVVAFRQPARIEAGVMAHERSACARWIGWRPVEGGVIVTLRLPDGNEARDARLGNRIVIDVFPTPEPFRPPSASAPASPPASPTAEATAPPNATPADGETADEANAQKAAATLRFSWPDPTAAAVAVRDRTLWIVFDQPSQQDTGLLRRIAGERRIAAIRQRPHPRATILELTMTESLYPRLEKDGLAWVVRLAPTRPPAMAEAIVPLPVEGDGHAVRLVLPVAEPAEPVAFTDPAGGSLVFVPVGATGRGISRGFAYPEARLLAAPQGIAIAPLTDDLTIRSLPDGVELSRPNGLAVSPASEAERVIARLQAVDRVERIVAAQDWPDGSIAAVRSRQEEAHRSAAGAGAADRDRALAQLARFYLAAGLAAEALGATETRLALRPELERDAESRLVAGISRYLLGRLDEAGADFAAPAVAATDEGRMWATLARHAAGDNGLDSPSLPVWTTLIAGYPQPLARTAGLALLDAAVDAGEATTAGVLLAALRALSTDDGGRRRPRLRRRSDPRRRRRNRRSARRLGAHPRHPCLAAGGGSVVGADGAAAAGGPDDAGGGGRRACRPAGTLARRQGRISHAPRPRPRLRRRWRRAGRAAGLARGGFALRPGAGKP